MSKKVISVKNFKLGLDRRRAEISSVPGALWVAKDGHINTGGEFEKRKAFVQYANLAILDENGNQGTFGLKSTINGLYTFGSAYINTDKQTTHRATTSNVATLTLGTGHGFVTGDLVDVVGITGYTASNTALTTVSSTTVSYANVHANEATTPDVTGTVRIHQTLSQVRLVSAIPAGITYQRLLHPAISDGVTYDASKYRMTGFVYATTFDNEIWVIVTFADGYRFAYYAGSLVQDFVAGYILPYQTTNVLISKHFTRLTNLTEDYTAVQQAPANDHKFTITGPIGSHFGLIKDVDTVGNGDLTVPAQSVGNPRPVVVEQFAVGNFQIMGGTASAGVNKITNVKVNAVEILNASVDWTVNNETTAAAVVAQINSYASTPEYTAFVDSNKVVIVSSTAGAAVNGYVIEITTAGDVCIGDWMFSLNSINGQDYTTGSVNTITADGVDILLGVPIAYTTSFSNTASLVATQIRAGVGTHGYLATSFGPSVRVSKKVTSSANPPVAVFVNATKIGVGFGDDPTVPPSFEASLAARFHSDNGMQVFGEFTVTVVGGIPPYTYAWYKNGPSYTGFLLPNTTISIIQVITEGSRSFRYFYYAIVTDSTGLTARTNDSPLVF